MLHINLCPPLKSTKGLTSQHLTQAQSTVGTPTRHLARRLMNYIIIVCLIIYFNDLCCTITYCKFLRFADDIIFFRRIASIDDRLLLQSSINSVQNWCSAKLNARKTRVISFSIKINMLYFNNVLITITIIITLIFCVQIVLKTLVSYLALNLISICTLIIYSLMP
jgi:hypothetical protein